MRRLSLILATAVAALSATPPPAMADRNSDAAVGAILGVMVAAAIAKNRGNSRFNYATDTVFYPTTLPGVMCYSRARQCYFRGHYSAAATRDVFQ